MASYKEMQNYYKSTNQLNKTVGQEVKEMSDRIMQETWMNDISTRLCYLYDYYHDDHDNECEGYDPTTAPSGYKVPVWLKFIVKEYKSAAKDDPEYHIQFAPDDYKNQTMIPEYWDKYRSVQIKFPIGLYVDIPDDLGIYHKWLCFYSERSNQFPKFGVMECNYNFRWLSKKADGVHKRAMWGVQRTQNSYNAGFYTYYRTKKIENQSKFWLPWNEISSEIYYDQRIIVSMPMPEGIPPITYMISKVENTVPKGINQFTLYQDVFDSTHDYIDPDDPTIMYADYYTYTTPDENIYLEDDLGDKVLDIKNTLLEVSCNIPVIKIGGGFKLLTANCIRNNVEDVTNEYKSFIWKYTINGVDVGEKIDTSNTNELNQIKIKFKDENNAEQYLQKTLVVTCTCDNLVDTFNLLIVAL